MSSPVLFIIGNGLDISLKLKTSYRNFYDYVKQKKLHPDNDIYKAIEKEDPEDWADFELGLGRYTNKIESVTEKEREAWSKKLNDELDEIKRDLKQYVIKQNVEADKHIPNINFKLGSFYAGLEVGQIEPIAARLNMAQQVPFQFVTLNYTDVLEKIFPEINRPVVGEKFYIANPIHHIHGSIDRRISLGVNDESQISSFIDAQEKQYLIKPELIKRMNDGRLDTLARMVNGSEIIVLFGVSLGATDKYIWISLIDWLFTSMSHTIVIHHHEEGLDVTDLTERESLQLTDRVKNKFLDYADLHDTDKEMAKNRIFVVPNTSELFSIPADQRES